MDNKKVQHYFLLSFLLGALILVFFILRPFIYVIILALVCAIFFEPVHKKILHFLRNNRVLAALITTAIIVIIILLPFIFLGVKIFQEAQQFFLIVGSEKDDFANISNSLISSFQKNVPFGQMFSIDIEQYVRQWSGWLLSHLAYLFGSITKLAFNFLLFIIITYFALKDGAKLKRTIIDLSPLSNHDDEAIFKKIKIAIHSVIKGSLVIAFIQGILIAIGFALFGIPNATLWGIAATLASLIPGIGTAIVSIPALVFLFFKGKLLMLFGLLVWSFVVVGLIDNFLRPILIGQDIKIHPLIVFLSVIGGIVFFGPIGFLLGPLAVSLLFVLFDIYISLRKDGLN